MSSACSTAASGSTDCSISEVSELRSESSADSWSSTDSSDDVSSSSSSFSEVDVDFRGVVALESLRFRSRRSASASVGRPSDARYSFLASISRCIVLLEFVVVVPLLALFIFLVDMFLLLIFIVIGRTVFPPKFPFGSSVFSFFWYLKFEKVVWWYCLNALW